MESVLGNGVRLVTTYEVLTEYLSGMSGLGTHYRRLAVQAVRRLLDDSSIGIISPSPGLFLRGLKRYEHRPDKAYSLVDCISMVVMEQEGITEVLTNDHHFEQEGFVVLIER